MFEHVYLAPERERTEAHEARKIVAKLFRHFTQPGNLPDGYEGIQGAVDYIAGMTDRFAIDYSNCLDKG
jgi:dGTPase